MLRSGKSVVVTGGNSGIGEAIVLAAAAEGANVVIDYVGPRGGNIAPGAVAVPINTSTENDPAKLQALDHEIPLGRVAQSSEIADVVVSLASGKAGYMTATTVVVDGGIMQGSVGL